MDQAYPELVEFANGLADARKVTYTQFMYSDHFKIHLFAIFFIAIALGLASCAGTMGTGSQKMTALTYPYRDGEQQESLLVMLPGINNSPTTFAANGLVATAQGSAKVDVVALDAAIRYYMDRSVIDRLHDEVIAPAREKGYKHIWLIGASMGGFGCLLYAQAHPDDLDGIILLAPFLGDGSLDKELRTAGGLAAWHYQPGSGTDEQDRKVREIWYWLQQYFATNSRRPAMWLGWGADDRFQEDATLLAAIMPDSQALRVKGGHDWKTWGSLFRQIVSLKPF